MPKSTSPVPTDVKQDILERVRKGEKPVAEVAQEQGISPQTIYGWLSHGAIAPPTFSELARLRKENEFLLAVIGKLTVQLTASEKRSLWAEFSAMAPPRTVTALAARLGVSGSSLYYIRTRPEQDWSLKIQIEDVLHDNPSYGSRRIADELHRNRNKVQRVMRLFGIHPSRRRQKRKKRKGNPPVVPYENLLLRVPFPSGPNEIWVSDFTECKYRGQKFYLATVMDLFARQIVGWHVSNRHTTELVLSALHDSLKNTNAMPVILHSDQGSEYTSKRYTGFVEDLRIRISMSRRGCPWENGYQESFYSNFKLDFGHPDRFDGFGELIAAIAEQIRYYNHKRIHSSLKMPPAVFARRHQEAVEKVETPA